MVQLSRADPLARTRIKGASDSSDSAFYSVSFVIFCTFSSPINSGRNFPFCRNIAAKAAKDSHGVNILFVKILPKMPKNSFPLFCRNVAEKSEKLIPAVL